LPGVAFSLEGLAALNARQDPHRAGCLFGAAEALREKIGHPLTPFDQAEYEHEVAGAAARLDAESWAALWAEGRTMSLEQATAYALEKAKALAHARRA
jgi:hypothetical protein